MTCIAGLIDDDDIYMGGDSASVGGLSLDLIAGQKVFKRGGIIVGICGYPRMMQLLQYNLTIPKCAIDPYKWACTSFVDAVRECFKDGGFAQKKDNVEAWGSGSFLVGIQGRIFEIQDNFQVLEGRDPWASVGCASDIALGSLHATQGESPRNRIKNALTAAERYSAGVRRPFHIKRLKGGE